MNRFSGVFVILTGISLLTIGCIAHTELGERATPKAASYELILGKALTEDIVIDFIASNRCTTTEPFRVCRSAGMALWVDLNQVVKTVYLYLNNNDGFEPYKGDLPFGLKYYDTLLAVEHKLNLQGIGNAGQPDEASAPDHIHYRASYHQAGLTILYNSPFADEDANIYAILVSK